jgi:chorismate mutase
MDIADWRTRIDEIDRRLVELLNERGRYAIEIGHLKRGRSVPIYEPDRERAIFDNVARHNRGPLSQRALRDIFERIIDEMRAIQKHEALGDQLPGAEPLAQPATGMRAETGNPGRAKK